MYIIQSHDQGVGRVRGRGGGGGGRGEGACSILQDTGLHIVVKAKAKLSVSTPVLVQYGRCQIYVYYCKSYALL
jgi:hypothetical protein